MHYSPVVPYKKTVTNKSTQMFMYKSLNKHNKLYFISKSLDEKLVEEIDNGNIKASDDMKLIDKYEWVQQETLINQEETTKGVLVEKNILELDLIFKI